MCDWFDSPNGATLMSVAVIVGGLHLMLTPSQSVLNFLDLPTFWGGRISAQSVLGGILAIGGICCLKNCME